MCFVTPTSGGSRPLTRSTFQVPSRSPTLDSFPFVPGPNVPFPPMEAQLVRELPAGDGWQYEPKWDGFRGVLENDGGELALWSRNERPLLRYFPELRPLGDLLPAHSALDGEIVIARDGVLDFDSMQTRLHPAESRIRKLSGEIPAELVVFDVLLWDGEPVWRLPLEERRARVEELQGFRISPATRELEIARGWLDTFEAAGLDGVVGKRLGVPYLPGSRDGVVKIKEHKTADCVVVGVRWKEKGRKLATLLLGLYDDDGEMDYVGSAAVAAKTHDDIFRRGRAAARGRARPGLLGAEPLGRRGPRGVGPAPGARRRGALRQGAGQPLPARHEADPLPRRQARGAVHVAGAPPAARPERTDLRVAARVLASPVRSPYGPGRAARVSARPASSGSSAGRAPRRRPPAPRARPTRAACRGR